MSQIGFGCLVEHRVYLAADIFVQSKHLFSVESKNAFNT